MDEKETIALISVKAKCPNCGGPLDLNPDLKRGICVYCGSTFLVREAIQKFTAEFDGIPTVKSMLIRAEQMLSDGDWEGAVDLYEEILKCAPTCHEAWWGKFKANCVMKWRKNIELLELHFPHDEEDEDYEEEVEDEDYKDKDENENYEEDDEDEDYEEELYEYIENSRAVINNLGGSREALRAIEYAPDDVKDSYRGEIEQIKRRMEASLAPWAAPLEAKREAEREAEREAAERKKIRKILSAAIFMAGCIIAALWWDSIWRGIKGAFVLFLALSVFSIFFNAVGDDEGCCNCGCSFILLLILLFSIRGIVSAFQINIWGVIGSIVFVFLFVFSIANFIITNFIDNL